MSDGCDLNKTTQFVRVPTGSIEKEFKSTMYPNTLSTKHYFCADTRKNLSCMPTVQPIKAHDYCHGSSTFPREQKLTNAVDSVIQLINKGTEAIYAMRKQKQKYTQTHTRSYPLHN